jgi:hypothetical protein
MYMRKWGLTRSSQRHKVSQDDCNRNWIDIRCNCQLVSCQGEERVFMFPGELVKSPMTIIDNDDIALMMHADIALIGLSVE